jgi:hypothetical protein
VVSTQSTTRYLMKVFFFFFFLVQQTSYSSCQGELSIGTNRRTHPARQA